MANVEKSSDVIIIGGGPAGLSAAVWCRELGLDAVLIEREVDVGGQLLTIHNRIENYLGLHARDGREVVARFRETLQSSGFDRIVYSGVIRVDTLAKRLTLEDGTGMAWRALIIASGVRRRRLNVVGEDHYQGKGVIESGVRDKESVKGKRVLVVGGGDAAIENALILSDVAQSVKIAFRRARSTARAEFQGALNDRRNIESLPETILKTITGDSVVTAVELENRSTGERWMEPTDAVLIRIGVEPNSELFRNSLDLDAGGYIRVDSLCRTNRAGVFGVGDVANPIAPTISSAAGMGATAAKATFHFLATEKHV